MKNILLVSILCLMCLSLNAQFSYDKGSAISQRQDNPNGSPEDNKQKIKTSVITIDLSSPTPDAIIHSGNFNRLMTIEKAPLSFRLINGNSLKYDYELLYKKVDLYGVSSFDIKPKNSANDSPTPLIDAPESVFVINEVVDETMIDGKKETIIKSILDIEEAKTRLDDFLTNVKTLSVDLEIYLADLRSSNNLNFENLEAIREEFNRYYSEISGYHINIKNEYRELSEDSQLLFATEMNQLDTEIEKIRQNIVTLYQVNEVVYTLPIDVDGDNIDYIEIELRRSFKDQLNATPEIYKYKVWIRGGVKIDVSGGGFITSLFDRTYQLNTIEGSTQLGISETDTGDYDFGFGAMVNISLRGGSWVRPTLNFGTLLTTDQKFQILAGGGLIIGKNQRWVIHGGLAMGRIDVLNSNFTADGTTPTDLTMGSTIPVTDKFAFGHYFGVSYNFNKPKSSNDTK